MIAHFSIPTRTPRETALFFASVIDGTVFDFPVVQGASIAVANDCSGLAVETYPFEAAHHPGEGEVDPDAVPQGPMAMPWEDQIFPESGEPTPSGFHAAMSTVLSEAEVVDKANAMGWRAIPCERGGVFALVEVWVDNKFLVEILTGAETNRYRAFMNPEGCLRMFGPGTTP